MKLFVIVFKFASIYCPVGLITAREGERCDDIIISSATPMFCQAELLTCSQLRTDCWRDQKERGVRNEIILCNLSFHYKMHNFLLYSRIIFQNNKTLDITRSSVAPFPLHHVKLHPYHSDCRGLCSIFQFNCL